jgi:hypothetical protein
MDYKLAKELFNTGLIWKNRDNFEVYKEDELPLAYYPTLLELIEALGEDFDALGKCKDDGVSKIVDGWIAVDSNNKRAWGQTPEIAVALLYLAIHSQELKDSTDMID